MLTNTHAQSAAQSAAEAAKALNARSTYQDLESLLDEAKTALIWFGADQVERLQADYAGFIAQNVQPRPHRLSQAEANRLASRCRTLKYLLRHAATNLSLLETLSAAGQTATHSSDTHPRMHRGYPWLR